LDRNDQPAGETWHLDPAKHDQAAEFDPLLLVYTYGYFAAILLKNST
jgi:hypothetical protein